MGNTIKGELTGLKDVLGRLGKVKAGVRNKYLRKGLTEAIKPLRDHAKWLAPVRPSSPPFVSGLLRKSMTHKVKVKGDVAFAMAGPRRGMKRQVGTRQRGKAAGKPIFQDPAKYGHLVERGHGGRSPAPPHPFVRAAWEAGSKEASATVARVLTEGIAAEAAK